jgi:hypothetical protein
MEYIYPSKNQIMEFFRNRAGYITVIDIATALVVPHVQRSTPMDEEWLHISGFLHELKSQDFLLVQGEGQDIYHEKFSSTPDRVKNYFSKDIIVDNSDLTKKTNEELHEIVRRNDNPHILTSLHNRALLELEIRHKKKIEKALQRSKTEYKSINISSIPKITLDNNCVINLFDFSAKTPTSVEELSEIIKFGLSGKADIAITTRVEADLENDQNDERRNETMRKLSMFQVVGTMGRWGVSKWNKGDVYAGEDTNKLFDEIQKIIFPGGLNEKSSTYGNKKNDIDHLVGHIINKRDIFVTDDGDIIKKQQILKKSPGLIIMRPKECLEYLENIEENSKKKFLEEDHKNDKYKSLALSGKVTFDYSNNNGYYSIGEGYFLFETKWSSASADAIHAYSGSKSVQTIALAKGVINIEDIKDASIFDNSSHSRSPDEGQIIVLKNENNIYAAIKIIDVKYDGRGDDRYELTFEYIIQTNGTVDFSV